MEIIHSSTLLHMVAKYIYVEPNLWFRLWANYMC